MADAYGAIAYYFRHKDEIDAYLRQREREAAALRREIEAHQGPRGDLRAKLQARREATRAQSEGADGE